MSKEGRDFMALSRVVSVLGTHISLNPVDRKQL